MSAQYRKGKLYEIPPDALQSDPGQPRKILDEQALEDMTASVGKVGVLQPIIFRTDAAGALIVVAGERRVAAARNAGLTTIPAIYISDANYAEVALVENLLRQDLTAVEEAEALQRLLTEQQYSQEQLGVIVGKARSTVGDILLLNKLPQSIRDECRGDRQISRATLIEIARRKQERGMLSAYKAYRDKQQKEKGPRQKKDINDSQALIDMFYKVLARVQSADISAWEEEERINFQLALRDLKIEIENYLANLPGINN